MAPSALRAVACASALLGASAVALRSSPEEQDFSKPAPADLGRWAHGPLFSANHPLYRATVRSQVHEYNLTIATFDRWEDQGVSGEILSENGWETAHIATLCQHYLEYGEIGNFLDVGANIGSFTIPMADCLRSRRPFHGSRVIAVEGMPPTADHLAMGILVNNLPNVDMYMYAVGMPGDPKKVTMSLNPVNKGGSSVKGNKPFTEMSDDQLQDLFHPGKKGRFAQKVVVEEYEVPLTTGDLMLKYNPALKAILIAKVDIEGHEGHFIKGSQNLFSKYPPCIMTIELIPEWLERAGTPVEEILDLLTGWGYGNVPTAANLMASNGQGKTKTLRQKNFTACLERVKANFQENLIAESDTVVGDIQAGVARAKELDALLLRP